MKKLKISILSSLIISSTLFTISNAQDNTYETYKKPLQKSQNSEHTSPEVQSDLNSLQDLKYLKLKTDSQYEIALANPDGTYSYVSSSDNLQFAINCADDEISKLKSNRIPVVINKDGLVVYATEGIGRIIKVVNGVPTTQTSSTANIYKTSELKSPEHTYLNHSYIDDVPIIESNGVSSKIEVSGYTGFIKNVEADGSGNIVVVPLNQAYGLSYYSVNSNGDLVHSISSDVTSANPSYSHQTLGPAPSFMKQGIKYYSYDSNYFYSDINILLNDTKENHHNNSINHSEPYYNYYQYLPSRSKTSYTADEIDIYFENNTPSDSVLRNTGKFFINAQNEYGTNAATLIGIAMNESARGTSNIAKTKFNIFGANAKDAFPEGADSFASVEECIMKVSNQSFSNGYFNPKSWKYNNSTVGNKSAGINVKYASDPFWSEKAVSNVYKMDKYLAGNSGLKDYNRYLLGIYTNATTIKNTLNKDLYNILPSGERVNLYGNNPSLGQVGDSTIILSSKGDNYEMRPDRIVGINEANINKDGTYLWDRYGVVNKNNIKIINEVANVNTDFANNWSKDYVIDAINKGWVENTNTFNPEGFIKRSEFIKIVNRAFNLTQKGTESFDDVNEGDWFYNDVCIAVKAGYINGRSDTEFAPYEPITRQEAAKIVGIMMGIENNSDITTSFSDDAQIANWADGYVNGLSNMGVLSGYGEDNTFRPNNNIKRGESVKILSVARK